MAKVMNMHPEGGFGQMIAAGMDAEGLSIRDVSLKLGVTYEHIRRLIKGLNYAGDDKVKQLAKLLKLNEKELMQAVTRDRIQQKYGPISGRPEDLRVVESFWGRLTPDQRQVINQMVKTMAAQNPMKRRKAS